MANEQGPHRQFLRRIGSIWVGLVLLTAPVATLAANNCPWLNEATASGFLAGEATGLYSPATPHQPAVCAFTQKDADVTRILKITVDVSPGDPHQQFVKSEAGCGSNPVQLSAIGNEAVACAVEDLKESRGTRAIGRVRDQLFEILITTTRKDDPILTRDALRLRIRSAAEQVSGNLF